jgi:hypothetical protein
LLSGRLANWFSSYNDFFTAAVIGYSVYDGLFLKTKVSASRQQAMAWDCKEAHVGMRCRPDTHLVVDGLALAQSKDSRPEIGGNVFGGESLLYVRS